MKYCPICERIYADEVGVCDVDGGILRDSAPKQDTFVGKTIKHRYRVIEKLGEGGMSVVYLAEQINIERKVALKVLHGEYARDETFVRRFRQEAKLAASLNHRNVIQIYDFDQGEDGNLFIAMEYLVGRNLKEVICAGTLEISQAVHLGIQIADGLGAAHRAGVIHRNIKPENIMVVGREDEVKLMDFGIARLREAGASTRLTRAGMIMGTPAYMAPEQIEGREINERTDIYAFGIVLYEMLSKRVPFTAPTPAAILMKHLKETPVPLRKLRREIPAQLERIVTQALEKQPERRPANMEQIAASLHKAEREFAPGTLAKTLMVTQPFEVIEADATRQESGARSLLGKIRRALGAKEHGSAVESSEEPRSQQEVSRGLESQEEGPAKTVLATVALTQPVEAIPGKRMNRKWIALVGGALLLVCVALWIGMVFYGQVPVQNGEKIVREPEKKRQTVNPIISAVISADKAELEVNERMVLRLTAQYADGTRAEIKENVEWVSNDPSVLFFVDESGNAEAKRVGKAQVSARYKGLEAPALDIQVIRPLSSTPVSEPRLVSLGIQADNREIKVKGRLLLRVRGRYSDGRESEIKKGVRWESSDSSIAAVNSRGEVLGQREGMARVIARSGEVASDPLSLVVKSVAKGREPEISKDVQPGKAIATRREPETVKDLQPGKGAEFNDRIRAARSYRERGEYLQALAELEKASKIDPGNKDVQGEIAITKRACNAERTLGRSDLNC